LGGSRWSPKINKKEARRVVFSPFLFCWSLVQIVPRGMSAQEARKTRILNEHVSQTSLDVPREFSQKPL